jgi:hypothetical protein
MATCVHLYFCSTVFLFNRFTERYIRSFHFKPFSDLKMHSLQSISSSKFMNSGFILRALNHHNRVVIRRTWNKVPIIILLSILTLAFMVPLVLSALQSSVSIAMQGSIGQNNFGNLNLKYSTNFENITKVTAGGGGVQGKSSMPINHNFWFGSSTVANWWMEGYEKSLLPTGVTPHSGTRCVGMYLPASGEQRAEFNIVNLNSLITGSGFYVSCYIFLPTTYYINKTDAWASMGDAFMTSSVDTPYCNFMLERPYVNGDYRMYMGYRDTSGTMHQMGTRYPFAFASSYLGAWHHLEYYVKLDTGTNGEVKYWLDGTLLFSITGIQTKNLSYDWFTTPIKLYYSLGEGPAGGNYIWLDDLQIYG